MNELVDDGPDRQAAVMVRSLSLSPSCSAARLMSFLSLYFLVVVAYFYYLPGICTTHTIGPITPLERRIWTLKNSFQVRKLCVNHFMFAHSTARSQVWHAGSCSQRAQILARWAWACGLLPLFEHHVLSFSRRHDHFFR